MSPIALGMDGLLALLLALALALGLRLNARLKTLRDSQAGFAAAAIELNQAAARAEAGLQALKTASESAHDDLLARIETARGLIGRLERAGAQAQRIADAPAEPPAVPARAFAPGGTLAAIAALAEGRVPARTAAAVEPRPSPDEPTRVAPPPPRRAARARVDDDLFEAKARDHGALGPLRPSRGER